MGTAAVGDDGAFGFEASGVVRSVGSDVQHFKPGDRVVFNHNGCFSTAVEIPDALCTKIPDSMTFSQAAAMPSIYGTAMYAIELARLQKGQVRIFIFRQDKVRRWY